MNFRQNIFSLILSLFLIYGCSKITKPIEEPMTNIEISQNDIIQETFIITEEEIGDVYPIYFEEQQIGEVEIDELYTYNDESGNESEITFRIFSRKFTNYTNVDMLDQLDTLRIDYQQDFDVINENINCGTFFDTSFGSIKDVCFSVWKDSILIDSIFTDSLGRFETTIEADDYILKDAYNMETFFFEFQLTEGYGDYFLPYCVILPKPNIYLYPETNISLDVNISFPNSGKVIVSIPQYPEQWQNLQIEPNGKINGKYNYLFYESIQPNKFQMTKGWVIKNENLENFFEDNMQKTGFNQTEINDFITHWIPKLIDSEYYAIYPQYNKHLDPLVQLKFSKQPDNILRLTYIVEEVNSSTFEMDIPGIPSFERKGFVVTEWGLIIEEDDK